MVAAITLARYSIDVLLIEKRDEVSRLSRNLVVSTRGMELMRAWGLEEAVREGAAGVEPRAWVTSSLASPNGQEMPLGYPSGEEAARVSPSRATWVPQDHHEPILLAYLRTLPSATVRFRSELVDLRQDGRGVHATVRDHGSDATYEAKADYVIAADGARSTVREHLDLTLVGPDDLAEYHRVEFEAPLAAIAGERRYGLYVITDPGVAGVLAPRGLGDRWSLAREWKPGQRRLDEHSHEGLQQLIAGAAGQPGLASRIERVTSFAFAAQLANRYRRRRGFLVGDAAHRMTPRGGTGMNTAIQDAFDLAWKLAWVLRGWVSDDLLESYEAERRPVAEHNVSRAGDPAGARRATDQALPWDLNGRIAHHWVRHAAGTVSTLDLIGDGLTLLAGPAETRWTDPAAATPCPVTVRVLDMMSTEALGLPPGGALLSRPDGHEICRWPTFEGTDWPRKGLALLCTQPSSAEPDFLN
jgi:2-polyprenyl-6-methoxyphenol hydroxylase-like FAD-dependent oxidoreductase